MARQIYHRCAVVLLVLVVTSPAVAARRRVVAPPPPDPPAIWLARHAIPLATTEAVGGLDDLAPLAGIVGSAHVVGLGDATHGTHEFFTLKLRTLQFLVQNMGFDVLAMEGSFPQFERINAYVQGGSGDIRQLLKPQAGETGYWFWQTDEFVAVIEWMRNFNMTRGSNRPPIEIVGADVYDGKTAANMVLSYLNGVDPAEASTAAQTYDQCVTTFQSSPCPDLRVRTMAITQQIAAKESDYVAKSSPRAFADAVHASTVITQWGLINTYLRDSYMADNVAWARDHRGSAHKVLYWAHDEHVTRGPSVYGIITPFTAGTMLAQKFGSDYVPIGSATYAGRYLGPSTTNAGTLVTPMLTPAGADDYETFFHASAAPNIIVPLRDPHPFLAQPHHMREAGSGDTNGDYLVNLFQRYDAVIFIDQSTPNHPLP